MPCVGPLRGGGEGVIERLWEKTVPAEATAPTPLSSTRLVTSCLQVEVPEALLYARVVLVTGDTGEPLRGEVEPIDPSLLLRLANPAAGRVGAAITARAGQCMRRAESDLHPAVRDRCPTTAPHRSGAVPVLHLVRSIQHAAMTSS